jgi:TRAP-type C4-dicarboxylate transport system permease large subunit
VVTLSLPAIPLFTLAGYLLAESHAPERLFAYRLRCSVARGGAAAVTVLAGAFFTAFTGISASLSSRLGAC